MESIDFPLTPFILLMRSLVGMTNEIPSPTNNFANILDGMRASIAARGRRKGPVGALLTAILRLLDTLAALLAGLKADGLAVASDGAARAACAATRDHDANSGKAVCDTRGARCTPRAASSEAGLTGEPDGNPSGCLVIGPGGCEGHTPVMHMRRALARRPSRGTCGPGLRRRPRSRPAAPSRLRERSPQSATCRRELRARRLRFKNRV